MWQWISSLWLKKIWISVLWNAPEWRIFKCHGKYPHNDWRKFCIPERWNAPQSRISNVTMNIFTLVEANLNSRAPKCSRIEDFLMSQWITSRRLKRILNSRAVKCSNMKDFQCHNEYLHHSWRKFWIPELWNASE